METHALTHSQPRLRRKLQLDNILGLLQSGVTDFAAGGTDATAGGDGLAGGLGTITGDGTAGGSGNLESTITNTAESGPIDGSPLSSFSNLGGGITATGGAESTVTNGSTATSIGGGLGGLLSGASNNFVALAFPILGEAEGSTKNTKKTKKSKGSSDYDSETPAMGSPIGELLVVSSNNTNFAESFGIGGGLGTILSVPNGTATATGMGGITSTADQSSGAPGLTGTTLATLTGMGSGTITGTGNTTGVGIGGGGGLLGGSNFAFGDSIMSIFPMP